MSDDKKNLLIGAFVLSACALVVWMLMFIHPSVGDGGQVIRVRFSDIDKVNVGTRVTHAGRPVGEVIALETVPNARALTRPGDRRKVFIYELTVEVDSSVEIYNSDDIAVRTSGLLGERSIAIIPRIPKDQNQLKLVSPNEILYASGGGSVEEALADMGMLMTKASTAMDEVLSLVSDNKVHLADGIKNFSSLLGHIDISVKRVNETDLIGGFSTSAQAIGATFEKLNVELETVRERELVGNLADTIANFHEITDAVNQPEQLESIVENIELLSENLGDVALQLSGSWPKVDSAIDNISSAAISARAMMQSGNELIGGANKWLQPTFNGKGTIGKLLNSDDFYLRLSAVMSKADTLMNDLNHYGFLFHLNRGWQRERTKRANALAKLETAGEFRDYFQEEMDRMNTSASRVSMLLAEAEQRKGRGELLDKQQFVKAFSELHRQVEALGGNIRLYNESLLEASHED